MTILLNKRECREFERVYQWLKIHPEWNMKNIFHSKSREYDEFKTCGRLFYVRIKQNRLMLASHESAHAVVFAATYHQIAKAEIDLNDNGVSGRVKTLSQPKNTRDCKWIDDESVILSKPAIALNALSSAAGFVGEAFVGRREGSNHEKFLVFCMTRFLDDLSGTQPLTNWEHYVRWCKEIILNNEHLFWRTTDELLKNSKLSNEFIELLHRAIKKESSLKFFYEDKNESNHFSAKKLA